MVDWLFSFRGVGTIAAVIGGIVLLQAGEDVGELVIGAVVVIAGMLLRVEDTIIRTRRKDD